MKICHLISGDLWAGAEVMSLQLVIAQKNSRKCTPEVLLLNEGRLADELRAAGVPVKVIDEKRHAFLSLRRQVRAFVNQSQPDILHSHRYKENLLAFLAFFPRRHYALVSTQHGLPESYGAQASMKLRMKNGLNFFLLKRFFSKVVAVSEDIKLFFLEKKHFRKNSVSVVHNGLCIPANSRSPKTHCDFTIGSSGRLFPVKDYCLMVKIAHQLNQRNLAFRLAGDGPEKEEIVRSIKTLGLQDSFSLAGHLSDMEGFFAGIDVYLNTSVHEGIPMAILEAMSRGIPIVAPRIGGIPEIVDDGVEGFLISGRDPESFAEKIALLSEDCNLYKRMSQAARSRAIHQFSRETMAAGYFDVYHECLAALAK